MSLDFDLGPQSYGLVRDDDTTGCQHILDHAQAERKPEIEPYGMGNHLCRKPVTTIERITCRSGHAARSHILIDAWLTLRCRPDYLAAALPSGSIPLPRMTAALAGSARKSINARAAAT